MTTQEQENLYALLKKRYPAWDLRRVSGYVHGAVSGYTRRKPPQVYLYRFKEDDPYSVGYIYGFIDAYGHDAVAMENWAADLGITVDVVDWEWWLK